jgi:hypothetical protein
MLEALSLCSPLPAVMVTRSTPVKLLTSRKEEDTRRGTGAAPAAAAPVAVWRCEVEVVPLPLAVDVVADTFARGV